MRVTSRGRHAAPGWGFYFVLDAFEGQDDAEAWRSSRFSNVSRGVLCPSEAVWRAQIIFFLDSEAQS